MVDITTIIYGVLAIIGGVHLLLKVIAPYTKNKTDDHIVKVLEKLLNFVMLNTKKEELTIKLKK